MNANIETVSKPKTEISAEVGHNLNWGRIVAKHQPTNNKVIPQDSAIDYNADLVIRNPTSNEVVDVISMKGTQTKGKDSLTSKTTYGLTITALIYELEGINSPQAQKVLKTAIEAATSNFKTVEERVAFWEAKGINWTNHDNEVLKTIRSQTKRTKTGSVEIHPNA